MKTQPNPTGRKLLRSQLQKTLRPYEPAEFLRELAPHILAELRPPKDFMRFTMNSDLVGDYVEAGVRQFVRRYLAPIRVSSGAVIDRAQYPGSKEIPQLDTIAWIPNPVPAVFEVGEFGLVPRSSSLGVLEVKSTAYNVSELAKRTEPSFVSSVTAELAPLGQEGGQLGGWETFGMGVVCLLKENQRGSRRLVELRKAWRVVVLFEERGDDCAPQAEDIYRLINFLAALRFRAARREGQIGINIDLLTAPAMPSP